MAVDSTDRSTTVGKALPKSTMHSPRMKKRKLWPMAKRCLIQPAHFAINRTDSAQKAKLPRWLVRNGLLRLNRIALFVLC